MKEPKWISHRGLRSRSVENTFLAFKDATEAGFKHLETDLRTTKDGVIVLHHDSSMEATAGLKITVEELSFAEFCAISLTDGQKGLSFEQFAEQFTHCQWILDIKPESGLATIRRLKDWCQKNNCEAEFLTKARFLLWTKGDHQLLQDLLPRATTLAGERECHQAGVCSLAKLSWLGNIKANRTYALPPKFLGLELFRKSLFVEYQKRGAKVLAYLPESLNEVKAALAAGADEILTNHRPETVSPTGQESGVTL